VEKNKQLAVNMISQIISFTVSVGISFFLTPFIVKSVGSAAYGFVGLAYDFVGYAQIATVALNSMAGRFITISLHQEKYDDLNKYFTSVIMANAAISVVLTIPFVIILLMLDKIVNVPGNILTDVTLLWGFVFLNFLLSIMGSVFSIAAFSKNRLDLTSFASLKSTILKAVILVIAFYFFKPSLWYIGLATVISTMYSAGMNISYTKKLLPYVETNKKYFDFQTIKILLSSGVWNSFTELSSIMSNGLDLLITNLFIGAAAMGSMAISKTLPTMILSVFAMLAGVFSPQLTIAYAKNDTEGMQSQLISSIKILGIFSCIPMAILFAYGDVFYGLWVPSQNARLLQTLSILACLAFVFVLPLEGLWNIFTVTNKVKQSSIFLFVNSVFTIAIVLIAMKFTKDINMRLYIVAGTSTVFSIIRALTFLPLYGARCLNLKWATFYPVILKNFLAVGIITAISFWIKHFIYIDSWIMLILAGIITTIISLALNSVLILGKTERMMLTGMAAKKFNRQ